MGFFSNLFGGSSKSKTKSKQDVTFPSWLDKSLQDYYTNTLAKTQELSGQPYSPYTGLRLAPQTEDQLQSYDIVRQLIGQAPEQYQQASDIASQIAQYGLNGPTQGQIDQYMNPYLTNVLDVSRQRQFQNYDVMRRNLEQQQGQIGAFGGSRSALAQSQLSKDFAQQLAENEANQLYQGYNQALGGINTGMQLAGNAATNMANIANVGQTSGLQGAAALSAQGGQQQAYAQQGLDIPYQQYLAEQAYPYQQVQFGQSVIDPMTGLLRGAKGETTTSSSQNMGLGTAAIGTLAALAGTPYGQQMFSNLGQSASSAMGGLANWAGSYGAPQIAPQMQQPTMWNQFTQPQTGYNPANPFLGQYHYANGGVVGSVAQPAASTAVTHGVSALAGIPTMMPFFPAMVASGLIGALNAPEEGNTYSISGHGRGTGNVGRAQHGRGNIWTTPAFSNFAERDAYLALTGGKSYLGIGSSKTGPLQQWNPSMGLANPSGFKSLPNLSGTKPNPVGTHYMSGGLVQNPQHYDTGGLINSLLNTEDLSEEDKKKAAIREMTSGALLPAFGQALGEDIKNNPLDYLSSLMMTAPVAGEAVGLGVGGAKLLGPGLKGLLKTAIKNPKMTSFIAGAGLKGLSALQGTGSSPTTIPQPVTPTSDEALAHLNKVLSSNKGRVTTKTEPTKTEEPKAQWNLPLIAFGAQLLQSGHKGFFSALGDASSAMVTTKAAEDKAAHDAAIEQLKLAIDKQKANAYSQQVSAASNPYKLQLDQAKLATLEAKLKGGDYNTILKSLIAAQAGMPMTPEAITSLQQQAAMLSGQNPAASVQQPPSSVFEYIGSRPE